ncbi:hypothetical protein AB1K70_23185 [Bremerella sp. JC770]|uniref:hypothetical protein n=1 Tax=Bremerella sp. JC770 TaxID=3232137 RepID=UPI0034584BDC
MLYVSKFMLRNTRVTNALVMLLLLFAATGCQQSVSYEMVPASGIVQLDGEPLANAKVVFHSETNPRAFGTTDSQGRFQLSTLKQGEGVPRGDFIVKIVSTEDTKSISGKAVNLSPLYGENGVKIVTVSDDNENDFEIALKSRPTSRDYMSTNTLEEP